jgi:hypothetical protein
MGVDGPSHSQAALPKKKIRYPLLRKELCPGKEPGTIFQEGVLSGKRHGVIVQEDDCSHETD